MYCGGNRHQTETLQHPRPDLPMPSESVRSRRSRSKSGADLARLSPPDVRALRSLAAGPRALNRFDEMRIRALSRQRLVAVVQRGRGHRVVLTEAGSAVLERLNEAERAPAPPEVDEAERAQQIRHVAAVLEALISPEVELEVGTCTCRAEEIVGALRAFAARIPVESV